MTAAEYWECPKCAAVLPTTTVVPEGVRRVCFACDVAPTIPPSRARLPMAPQGQMLPPVICDSGKHVFEYRLSGFVTRPRTPEDVVGVNVWTHEVGSCCSPCIEERKAFVAKLAVDERILKAAPELVAYALASEWTEYKDNVVGKSCRLCSVFAQPSKQENPAPNKYYCGTSSGHDIQCGIDRLLTSLGLDTQDARREARLALGMRQDWVWP